MEELRESITQLYVRILKYQAEAHKYLGGSKGQLQMNRILEIQYS